MNALYAEVIASVLAAGVLGLGCGWMMQRGRAARTLKGTIATWEKRYDALRDGSGDDTEELETRLESLGQELRELTARNRELESSLAERETALESARGDAIELNRRQAAVQQKLQSLLRQRNGAPAEPRPEAPAPERAGDPQRRRSDRAATARPAKDDQDVEAYIDRLGQRGQRGDVGTPDTATSSTVARVEPTRPPARPAPARGVAAVASTVPAAAPMAAPAAGVAASRDEGMLDATVLMGTDDDDETATLMLDPAEFIDRTLEDDSTIAFDDATLARVRRRSYE